MWTQVLLELFFRYCFAEVVPFGWLKKIKIKEKKSKNGKVTRANVSLLVLILMESRDKHSKRPKEGKFFRFHPVTSFFTENLD